MPNNTGGENEPPDAKENVEGFSTLTPEKQQQAVDDILGELFPTHVEIRSKDGREDKRGSDETQRTIDRINRRIVELAKKSDIAGTLKHTHGGRRDGGDAEYLEEKTITSTENERNRPDSSYKFKESDNPKDDLHFNTMTTRKDGTPIERERISFERLRKTLGDAMQGFRKRLPNESLADYEREADAFATRIFNEWHDRVRNLPKQP